MKLFLNKNKWIKIKIPMNIIKNKVFKVTKFSIEKGRNHTKLDINP